MRTEVNISKKLILWAIARAGYDVHEFETVFPPVQAWLEEKKKPTIKQLESFSQKVHVPFGYLFLEKPPQESVPIPFYRAGKSSRDNVSLNLYDTLLLLQRRQQWLHEYLADNDTKPLPFVGKFKGEKNYKVIVQDIRNTLGLSLEWASKLSNHEEALNYIAKRVEDIGVITVFNGVVENNNNRTIEAGECRGFVLVDMLAPFMFINASDGKAAQLFTIVHELAHIWTGHSAGFDNNKLIPADDPVEILCDSVAAEFLVPELSFIEKWKQYQDIPTLARYFKVSRIVIARRALDLNVITKADFFKLYASYTTEVIQKKENQGDGGNFYATQKKRLSSRFLGYLYEAIGREQLLFRDAYKLTGLKGETFHKSINEILLKS